MIRFISLFIVFHLGVVAQQITNPEWRNYLNSETVYAITEENDYLWIGTLGGIIRLNKFTFEKEFFNKGNSKLTSNKIHDIKVDLNGYKWVATSKGLIKFKENDWIVLDTTNSGIPTNDISVIDFDSFGNLWLGTFGGGFCSYDGNTWQIFNTGNSPLPSDYIYDFSFENGNTLWIGTNEGLVKKEGDNWTIYNTSNSGLTVNFVQQVKVDKHGNKWIGVVSYNYLIGGLFKFDGINWTNYLPSGVYRNYNSIYSIVVDSLNNKWIAANIQNPTYGGGVYKIDSTDNEIVSCGISLPFNWVNRIYIDKQNTKWCGTKYGFVKHVDSSVFINISNSKLGHNEVLRMVIDTSTNKKCFASYGAIPLSGEVLPPGFLSINKDTEWVYFNYENSPIIGGVNSMTFDNEGNLFATLFENYPNDLYKITGNDWNNIPIPQVQNYDITYLYWDVDKLWVCFEEGEVFQYNGNSWTQVTGSPVNSVRKIVRIGDKYYCASFMGLVKYENGVWTQYTKNNSPLPSNKVNDIAIDLTDNLWIGTENGLAYFDGMNWIIYNSANSPLESNIIQSIVVDKAGKLYIGTDKGLIRKSGDNWRHYTDINSGLPDITNPSILGVPDCLNSFHSLAVDTSNHIWMATGGGVGVYNEFGIPVPVELLFFSAVVNDYCVNLSWVTATETNNYGFAIERKVYDKYDLYNQPVGYSQIGFIEGNGTTAGRHQYSFTDNVNSVGQYSYRLKQINFDGTFEYHLLNDFVEVGLPSRFELKQNYPNPFNPVTTIRFSLPSNMKSESTNVQWEQGKNNQLIPGALVKLVVYDILGREVTTLVNEPAEVGTYEVKWDASAFSSGVYFYRLTFGSFIEIKKMMLLR